MSAIPEAIVAEVVERTVQLSAIPAPPMQEAARAAIVAEWWSSKGLTPTTDEVGNVWARLREGPGEALIICAHMDMVFDADVPHGAVRDGDQLLGPGVGDDTVALAALTMLDELLPDDLGETWILATVGEEGLGNLAGIRSALDNPRASIGAVVALEGNYLGRVVRVGVGSVRWRLTLTGPGGHAWEAAHEHSAVHETGRVIGALDSLTDSAQTAGRWTLNVGTVTGGEAINARAARAVTEIDIRADDPDTLRWLELEAMRVIEDTSRVEISVDVIGQRPAGSIPASHPMVAAAERALAGVGIEPVVGAASTDANAAYARGIPAITIGITTGGREHTLDEWISVPPIAAGMSALVSTITELGRGRQ